MSLILKLFIETLQFYKVTFSRSLRFIFVLLLAARYFAQTTPLADHNFSPFLQSFSRDPGRPDLAFSALSSGNWLSLAFQLGSYFLALILALHYALAFIFEHRSAARESDSADQFILNLRTAYTEMAARRSEILRQRRELLLRLQRENDETDERAGYRWSGPAPQPQAGEKVETANFLFLPAKLGPGRFALLCLLKKAPGLFFLALLSFFILLISLPLLALPFVAFAVFFCLTPLIYGAEKQSLPASFRLSWQRGRGVKSFLGMQLFLTLMLFNFPDFILSSLFVSATYSYLLCQSLLFSLKTFVLARLWSIFYLSFSPAAGKDGYPASEL